MEKDIQNIEAAILVLADVVESGEWQGVGEKIRTILNYKKDTAP